MIELLIIWLVTIIASYGLKLVNELRLFKKMADFGYKVNIKQLFRLGTKISKKNIIANISMLIPLYNISINIEEAIKCSSANYKLFGQSGLIDMIKRMTDEEKKQYLENPTCLNAAHISLEENLKEVSGQLEEESQKCATKPIVERITNKRAELQNLKQELLICNFQQFEVANKDIKLNSIEDYGYTQTEDLAKQKVIEKASKGKLLK